MTSAFTTDLQQHNLAGTPDIKRVPFDAPWNWLGAGWRDLWSAPQIGLAYGSLFSLCAFALAYGLSSSEALPLILPLAGTFLLLGPLFAPGLYEVSRLREQNKAASFAAILAAMRRSWGQLALFGLVLLLINFIWMLAAFLLFMLFFGSANLPPLEDFVPALLFTHHGLGLLVTGTAAGAVLAAITYAISAISVPMLLDRRIDAVSAVLASIQAVRLNLPAMTLWAALILALTATGIAALFLGLAVTFPLIGHATWHAYRELTGSQ